MATARWRTHGRAELEVLPVLGRLFLQPSIHASTGDQASGDAIGAVNRRARATACRQAGAANRRQFDARASTAPRQAYARHHRRVLRGELDHAALGCDPLSAEPRKLERELLRLERSGLWLGRGPHRERSEERRVGIVRGARPSWY